MILMLISLLAAAQPVVIEDPRTGLTATVDVPEAAPAPVLQLWYVNGPMRGDFQPNVNAQLQRLGGTLDTYRTTSLAQFAAMKLEVVADKKLLHNGKDAWLVEYAGTMQGRDMHFLGLAMDADDEGAFLLVTATAMESSWAQDESWLRAAVMSVETSR